MPDKFGKYTLARLLRAQKNEATEAVVYARLAVSVKDTAAAKIFAGISRDEKRHYDFYRKLTETEVSPDRGKIFRFFWIAKIFGLTFGIRLMEKDEGSAQKNYAELQKELGSLSAIIRDEEKHEHLLIDLINEEKLQYIGSVVLGLSDALVELTGMLAGLTLAMQNAKLIALAGLITGVAAALSMAASQYLAVKHEKSGNAYKSAVYTGVTYIFTVILLVAPYLLFKDYFLSLAVTMALALVEIVLFNFYISVAKNLSFKKRFWEMTLICISVAAISFVIGYFVKILLNVNV